MDVFRNEEGCSVNIHSDNMYNENNYVYKSTTNKEA